MDFMSMKSVLEGEHVVRQILSTVVLVGLVYGAYLFSRYYIRRNVMRPELRQSYWSLSRNVSILIGVVLIGSVWLEELKTVSLLLTGLLAALLVVNKEVFLGLAGRVLLATAEPYRIGDRIRIDDICGDVIDIGLLYTRAMEVGYDGQELQSTGRIITIPHMWLSDHAIVNSTLGHAYLWDEISLAFPLDVDGGAVARMMEMETTSILAPELAEAQHEVNKLALVYASRSPPVTPVAYARVIQHASGHQVLQITLRFSVPARRRRDLSSRVLLHLLKALRARGIPLYTSLYQTVPAPSPAKPAEAPNANDARPPDVKAP
jgi:small-conductance mechanosensitive channel